MKHALILVCLALPAIAGCDRSEVKLYPVRGVVRFPDGKLLREGYLEFENTSTAEPMLARAEIQPDGSFVLGTWEINDGAAAGNYRAAVISQHMIGNGPERPGLIPESKLHNKYREFRTSGLEYMIEEKTNNIVVEVDYAPDPDEEDPNNT